MKKAETQKLVELEVKREEALAAALDEMEPSDVDTDDELDEATEFTLWKVRELERLKEDRIQRELAASISQGQADVRAKPGSLSASSTTPSAPRVDQGRRRINPRWHSCKSITTRVPSSKRLPTTPSAPPPG